MIITSLKMNMIPAIRIIRQHKNHFILMFVWLALNKSGRIAKNIINMYTNDDSVGS